MKHTLIMAGLLAGATILTASPARACEICDHSESHAHHSDHIAAHISSTANEHAPIGVMGDHMHKQGEWMVSYRFKHMSMNGNRDGTDDLSPAEIIALPNPNAPPANLRVVPTNMDMNMHMVGGMYAPTDWLTLMAMGMYMEKEMEHITFNMAGADIGGFETRSSGWGDTTLGGLVKLYRDDTHHVHLNLGLSLPTGSIKEQDTVLAPNGMTPSLRLPYGMQLGSGTYDALPGLTYTGRTGAWEWGAQYSARIPLESENDEGYRWDDKHMLTAWGSYEWAPWISTSARLTGETQGEIHGRDTAIAAPVQSANPDNYGGETLELGLGVNLMGQNGYIKDHRLAFEVTAPLYQDLNGPQMKRDYAITLGWQYAF